MKLSIDPCTPAEFGGIVGISRQAASALVERNVISTDQTPAEMILSYCQHLREVAISRGTDGDLAYQRAEMARVSRERNEINLAKDRRDFVPVELLELVCTHVGYSVASVIESLPDEILKICPTITDHAMRHTRATIAKACEAATSIKLVDFENPFSDSSDQYNDADILDDDTDKTD